MRIAEFDPSINCLLSHKKKKTHTIVKAWGFLDFICFMEIEALYGA
jgi:hypothetical protein